MSDYDLFGQIAMRNRFTSLQHLEEGLNYQAEKDPYTTIGQILRGMGYLTTGAIAAVLQVQGQLRNPEENNPLKAANTEGKRILKMGFSSREQVIECLKEVKSAIKFGNPAPDLAKLLHNRGHIDEVQLLKLEQGWDDQGFPQIDGYKILADIRSGGMGTVYKARQLGMHRIVALKILSPKLARTDTHLKRFMAEARAQARLNHQNIVGAIEVGTCRGLCFFVMEYVNGESAMEAINRDGPYKLRRAVEICYEMARALEHTHSHRIIHRDIKPSNILINHKGETKLCDLGFAKIDDEDVMLGMAGTTLGTPYYMSPEQARGQDDVGERSDIYSLGASLFHMLTQRTPFYGKTATEVMKKHIHTPLKFRTRETSLFGQELIDIITKMMAKKQEDRYESARDVMVALAPFLSTETVGTDLKLDSQSAPLIVVGQPTQLLVIHEAEAAPSETSAVLEAIAAEGGVAAVTSANSLSWQALQEADGLLIGVQGERMGPAIERLFEDATHFDGKVVGAFAYGDSPGALRALCERLLDAGAIVRGSQPGSDQELCRTALGNFAKLVCELARHRVAVGGV